MRHLTRLFGQINYLITPPPYLISTHVKYSFTANTHQSPTGRLSLEDLAKDDKVIGVVAGRASPICSAHCFQLLA
jgi:hypothetical protein